jgi:hypothetical protein
MAHDLSFNVPREAKWHGLERAESPEPGAALSTAPARNRRDLRALQAGLAQMSLAEMLAYYQRCEADATTERRREFCRRMQAKVRESIGVTLGLRRRS